MKKSMEMTIEESRGREISSHLHDHLYIGHLPTIYLPSLAQLSFTSPADETILYLFQRAFYSAAPCMNPLCTLYTPYL